METRTIFGLVTAYEWDDQGNPTKLKICADGEDDYFVVDNDHGKQLVGYLRDWVFVTGQIIRFETQKAIDIETISKNNIGGCL